MKIIKIPEDKQKRYATKSGDKYDIELSTKYRIVYPDEKPGKEKSCRRFSIKKLK